jgi:hypothetical protein
MSRKGFLMAGVAAALASVGVLLAVTAVWAEPGAEACCSAVAASQTVSSTLTYQGRLLNGMGSPVDGTKTMTFSLYAEPSGGDPLWTHEMPVEVHDGYLDAGVDVDPRLFDGRMLWLGVHVEGDSGEMVPRQELTPAPYALSLRPGALISANMTLGGDWTYEGVLSVVNMAADKGSYAIRAVNHSESVWRPAVYGENKGASAGIYGRSDGWHAAVGWNVSDGWAGVFGRNSGAGQGVLGHNEGTGVGVKGTSTDGFGVVGHSDHDVAVYGEAIEGTAAFFTSTQGVGVHGVTPSGNAGVLGHNMGTGPGVVGISQERAGVFGESDLGPGGYFTTGQGHSLVTVGPTVLDGPNRQQIALLKWYPAITTPVTFTVGAYPTHVAFDGANMWVSNGADGEVTVLRANSGEHVMTVPVGDYPAAMAYDGANMWVINEASSNVSVIRASDGTSVMTVTTGSDPTDIAFDGAHMWVTDLADQKLRAFRPSDGVQVMTATTGLNTTSAAFDGQRIWVVNRADENVAAYSAADATFAMSATVGTYPTGVAFDGANLWVANYSGNSVTVVRASDGFVLETIEVGSSPYTLAFDGSNMWVAHMPGEVRVLRVGDGKLVKKLESGGHLTDMAFDGAHMWIPHLWEDMVSKH